MKSAMCQRDQIDNLPVCAAFWAARPVQLQMPLFGVSVVFAADERCLS